MRECSSPPRTAPLPLQGRRELPQRAGGDHVAENAVWSYPEPAGARWLRGYAAIYRESMDSWWDEDEDVFGHLRDPYHRVDVRASARQVRVLAGDALLAESDAPLLLSETGLPNMFYLPEAYVCTELLVPAAGAGRERIADHICFDPTRVRVDVTG